MNLVMGLAGWLAGSKRLRQVERALGGLRGEYRALVKEKKLEFLARKFYYAFRIWSILERCLTCFLYCLGFIGLLFVTEVDPGIIFMIGAVMLSVCVLLYFLRDYIRMNRDNAKRQTEYYLNKLDELK